MCPYYSLYCFMRHLYAYFCCLLIDVAKYAKNKATNMGPTGATLRATADSHTPPEGKGRMREWEIEGSNTEETVSLSACLLAFYHHPISR